MAAFASLAGSAAAQQASSSAESAAASDGDLLNTYTMGTGDKVRVTVFGEDDLSGDYLVDDSGSVVMPLIGKVPALNKTVPEFESAVIATLKQGFLKDPNVSVQILTYRPFFISGEVNKSDAYPYVVGLNAPTAIAMAGGYTYRANKNKIYITRAKTKERKEYPADQTTIILPGDVIQVPERYF